MFTKTIYFNYIMETTIVHHGNNNYILYFCISTVKSLFFSLSKFFKNKKYRQPRWLKIDVSKIFALPQ